MADPPPMEEANFIGEFDGLVVPPLDRTFFALHMTATYHENVEDFPMEFQNINFTIDDIILDESFNDIFPNPTNDDAFQNPNCLPDYFEWEMGLELSQMNPNNFGQPKSQLIRNFDDASGTIKSTSEYCLGEALGSNKPVHFSPNLENNLVKSGAIEQKLKLEGVNANISNYSDLLKERSEDSNNVRKHQKSTLFSLSDNVNNDEDKKKMPRKIRNKEGAHLSRKIKKHYVKELEDKHRILHSTIQHFNAKLSYEMAKNATLKAQLGGSQVPLVPIPKWKSHALAPAPKSSKKVEKKKSEVKTKKVSSASFLGVLFFMLLFGRLFPLLKVRYKGMSEPFMSGESFVSGFYEKHRGRVLTIDEHMNGTGYFGKYGKKDHSLHCGQGGQGESNQQNSNKVVDEFIHVGYGSDPLAASLYVPRNDKLVEIDRNLIIQSVLASEKAMASHGSADKENRKPGLVVPGDLAPSIPGIHPRLYRSPAVGERVLGSEEKDNVKATIQQWYLEGVAGPLLSSNMCTEVYEFNASSSAPQSIVPVTNARDISMEERQNGTRLHRNRRILNGPSVSLSRPSHSISEEQTRTNGKQENVSRSKSLSSLVVSVLVDGDGDGDGIMGPNSISRIFIVVLIDSVKYVTYSCMLPFIDSVHVAEESSKHSFVDTTRSTINPH
ncbi:hypothetical protein H5410_022178 [Solanum commersonii]|uniref:BZIP domain-containing protein n=1 Tax=Solanum commersonii TaxID=4109 RepID=A0A9J5ZDG8_SOLCO|nr:hypothetical protein H5410_022178 [Solanum commersonii]